jgi:hypothetical protein
MAAQRPSHGRFVGLTGSYPEAGFAEISSDVPETDLRESARFHLSDYRLVARHNIRVARDSGILTELCSLLVISFRHAVFLGRGMTYFPSPTYA